MKHLFTIFFLSITLLSGAQDTVRMESISDKISYAVAADRRFDALIDVTANRIPLTDLLRNIAVASGVNISSRGVDSVVVNCNFSRSKVSEILGFLCREYNLGIEVSGAIISIYPILPPPPVVKEPNIRVSDDGTKLSCDLSGDELIKVVKKINNLTGINIVIPPEIYGRSVSAFVSDVAVDNAIMILCQSNNLQSIKNRDGIWSIRSNDEGVKLNRMFGNNEIVIDSLGLITVQLEGANLASVLGEICGRTGVGHFFITPVNSNVSINVSGVTMDHLLDALFTGTEYSYYKNGGIYFFGASSVDKELNSVQIYQLKYRSANKIDSIIPAKLKAGLSVEVFGDLNSVVMSGSAAGISRIKDFLVSIDKPVPLIMIDILIVESKSSKVRESGVKVGFAKEPVHTIGTIGSGGVDMTLGAGAVNSLLDRFSGFGSVNLGKVGTNFYVSLKLLEDNGDIKLQSTPRLSTLNGHSASLKSGETQYYKEVTNSFIGTQNPIQSESFVWKSVDASLDIKITPFVSRDSTITMDISIEQSEFTSREEKNAPPGTTSRGFNSLVRVSDGDMVLLGGIERNSSEQGSGGIPFLSRIPVLKWFFGSAKNNKHEQKLNVFIKPTVIQ